MCGWPKVNNVHNPNLRNLPLAHPSPRRPPHTQVTLLHRGLQIHTSSCVQIGNIRLEAQAPLASSSINHLGTPKHHAVVTTQMPGVPPSSCSGGLGANPLGRAGAAGSGSLRVTAGMLLMYHVKLFCLLPGVPLHGQPLSPAAIAVEPGCSFHCFHASIKATGDGIQASKVLAEARCFDACS